MEPTQVKTERSVTLIGKNGQAQGILADLSTESAGVQSPRGAQVGTELELVFEIPTAEYFRELRILGKVTHRHNTSLGAYLKLQFEAISPLQRQYINEFIAYKQRLAELGKKSRRQDYR
ncbi:MAG: PilZ domain-containing protein [Thiotrichales bacterium]|nr:PilZ domain-containing protein [Thiotrichales bacterium]